MVEVTNKYFNIKTLKEYIFLCEHTQFCNMLLYKCLRVWVNPSKRGGIDMVLQGLAGLLWGISRGKSKRRILKCLCHYIGLFGKSTNLSFLNVFLMICCKWGCHPILTENANFVTNALRGDLSTGNMRLWCGHHTCSVQK